MGEDPLFPDHKLCGFFRAVLAAAPPLTSLAPGTRCSLHGEGPNAGFVTEGGTRLLPLGDGNGEAAGGGGDVATLEVDWGNRSSAGSSTPSSSRKRKRKIGLVNGSMSVVHQLHALVAHKCVGIEGRVVEAASRRGEAEVRVAVLVDVYLPMAVWSGWQFPKSGVLAASLFKHVSCDWELRNTLIANTSNKENSSRDEDECLWDNSNCHVLGCKTHCSSLSTSRRKLFDLHEVFNSLPSTARDEKLHSTNIKPEDASESPGMWNVSDDVIYIVLSKLGARDLANVACACRHLRLLALSTMPSLKVKLFPHQQAAVEWMLKRERFPKIMTHPLYMELSTEDGFYYYVHAVSGKMTSGLVPTIYDSRGGMFCDEPGLGKTVTALSLVLKTHGTLADPPQGIDVIWCTHGLQKCGYYEVNSDGFANNDCMSTWKRTAGQNARRGQKLLISSSSDMELCASSKPSPLKKLFDFQDEGISCTRSRTLPAAPAFQCNSTLNGVKKSLLDRFEINSLSPNHHEVKQESDRKHVLDHTRDNLYEKKTNYLISCKKQRKSNSRNTNSNETWVQCDACRKWRKLNDKEAPDATAAWFCSMNSDKFHQNCGAPEELWDRKRYITYLPGFYTKGTDPGNEQNTSFFIGILKENFMLMNSKTRKALNWLAKLSHSKLSEMEANGLTLPIVGLGDVSGRQTCGYEKIFQAFGLVRKVVRGTNRWYYPRNLESLAFDSISLQVALTKPLDLFRLYLSRATLIIVPANLVEHWKTQIQKVVHPGQLRIFVWTDHKKPSAHNLAWDYEIVITTFNRLSAEWTPHKRSVLMQVHWLRVILDEGHTLGSSLSLTNKLQMAISLPASNRWILTGTPTPNTPNSQLTHLQPMLKFLHEEAYGQDLESWDAGILKPFEAEMEEGRYRLLQLLQRVMISARKKDLNTIPPCIKNVTFLHFSEEHARSYNELVVTVRRNILMADWNDPSHVESLLNPKQWKLRSNTIRNVRLSCCVAGHIKVAEAGHDIQDTMDILVQQGLDPISEEYGFIRSSLLNGGSCLRCKDWCRLPVITPCRHLLCLDCVTLDSERCTYPGCGIHYEMQYPEALTRPENPNPKWPVPKDLIELQPSYRQDNWDPDWQSTSSSKVAYLVGKLKELQELNSKICCAVYWSESELFLPPKNINFLTRGVSTKANDRSYLTKPHKIIIFSQFLEHIHVIEQQFTIAGISFTGMYSPMHSSNKIKSLMVFQQDANCMALLMDGSAALGLDLSFVTHVFLMEPIWDRSMEEQVISRAHRMGATRPIHVETLAMRGTIEEQMLNFLQDSSEHKRTLSRDLYSIDIEGTRARSMHDFAESNYLAHLSFIRTNSFNE